MTRLTLLGVLLGCLIASSACGPGVDLSRALEVTDVLTGFYDAGLKDGKNYLKPTVSFRLRNKGDRTIGPVQVTVSFWKQGEDAEWDSVVVQGIHGGGLTAGASTESILARSTIGYTQEGPRADAFAHRLFKDVTAKLFAGQSGAIIPIGQFKIDRVVIPHLQ